VLVTAEKLHKLFALAYYTRIRMAQNLIPQLQRAAPVARVLVVAGGGKEGKIYIDDLQALKIPLTRIRGHMSAIVTLGVEKVARQAPTVSFIHEYPGAVRTALHREGNVIGQIINLVLWLGQRWLCVPVEECGERHVFLATSPRYPAKEGGEREVRDAFRGSNGLDGSGAYSINWDCESSPRSVEQSLREQREEGIDEVVWRHTLDQFTRITET
jgi:hypothetical protein